MDSAGPREQASSSPLKHRACNGAREEGRVGCLLRSQLSVLLSANKVVLTRRVFPYPLSGDRCLWLSSSPSPGELLCRFCSGVGRQQDRDRICAQAPLLLCRLHQPPYNGGHGPVRTDSLGPRCEQNPDGSQLTQLDRR